MNKVNILDRSSKEKFDFSLRTYNVYANIFTNGYYVEGVWQRRKEIPKYLEWEYRFPRIISELIVGSPEVITLQEVEPSAFLQFQNSLKQFRYEGIMQNKKQYGNAVFFNTSNFRLIWRNDRSRVILVQLEHIDSKRSIFILNCHLEGHPLLPHVRFTQVKSMFKHVSKRPDFFTSPVIVCGDFNETPQDGVCHLLENGEIDQEFKFRGTELVYSKGKYSIPKRGKKVFKFRNSYKEGLGKDYGKYWTSQMNENKQTVDFVFYNEDFLKLKSVMKVHEEEEKMEEINIPSEDYPSDHFPLFAGFQFL